MPTTPLIKYAFIIALLLLATPAWSQLAAAQNTIVTVAINDLSLQSDSLPLGRSVSWVQDEARVLNARDLIENELALPNDMQWVLNDSETPNLGFADAAYWFALRLENNRSNRQTGLLEIAYPILDRVALFTLGANGEIQETLTGDLAPVSSRPIAHRNFLFPLTLQAGETQTILLRVETEGAMQLPISLWDETVFFEQDQLTQAFQFVFAGIMLAIVLYNLLIWVFVRQVSYLWYILNVATIALVQLSLHGLSALYLWPDVPEFNNQALTSFISLNILFVCLFTYSFLSLRKRGWFIRGFVAAFGILGLLCFILSWVVSYGLAVRLSVLLITIGAPGVWLIGLYLSYKGDVLARFYSLAWTILLVGHFLLAFNKIGIFPRTTFFEYAPQIGAAIEVILLSFALAYQINLERQKRFLAQKRALEAERENREIQEHAKNELELKVQERTQELEQANKQLQKMNSLDGLTGIHNRRFFDETLSSEWSKSTRQSTHICLLLVDVDFFKRFNDDYGHLCGDACLKHLAEVLSDGVNRAGDYVARYGGEEFAVLLCHTSIEGAGIMAERLRRKLEASPFEWEGESLSITVSIGVAGTEPSSRDDTATTLISFADEALYAAKDAGRNQVMLNYANEPDQEQAARGIQPLSEASLKLV